MRNDLFAMFFQQNRRLPAEYRRVEYLESSGAQWIDTGVVPNGNTGVDVTVAPQFTNKRICGTRPTSQQDGSFDVIAYDIKAYGVIFRFGSSYNKTLAPVTVVNGGKYRITLRQGRATIDDRSVTWTPSGEPYGHYVLPLFGGRIGSNTVEGLLTAKMFSCVLTQSDAKVRDFIPVVRISDSKPGVFDLCGSICPLTNTPFYVNAGTGADFTWGELS